jgi:hypothetical protein
MFRLLLPGLMCFYAGFASPSSAQETRPGKAGKAEPIRGFTENKGQIATRDGIPAQGVFFKAEGQHADVYITKTGLYYAYKQFSPIKNKYPQQGAATFNWCSLNMILENAFISEENIREEDPEPGYSNYYYNFCPNGITHVLTFRKVVLKNIYPHIDWILRANEKGELDYDFVVNPGGNPKDIRMRYEGAERIEMTKAADKLDIVTALGSLHEGRLTAFQPITEKNIAVRYEIHGQEVALNTPAYLKTQVLVIDPPLAWDVTYGSPSLDEGYAAALAKDGTNDLLITGEVGGTGFPTTSPAQVAFGGGITPVDAFVARFKNATGARVFSTYFGGSQDDGGRGIGSDNSGNAYVTGYTGGSFPVTSGTYAGGTNDCWAAKFTAAGALTWAFYYGGTGNDIGNALTTDAAGDSYITGSTTSPNTFFTGTAGAGSDAFVMKLNSAGTKQYAVKYGGNDNDVGRAIVLNGTSLYMTGSTLSSNFPVTAGVFQAVATGDIGNTSDAFILKVDEPTGATAQFSTYLGGNLGDDQGQGIALDASGNVYVTGYTMSSSFPTVNPGAPAYCVTTISSPGTHDAFIFECNGTATTKIWGTYFGGTAVDIGYAIGLDGSDGVCITGSTGSTNLPTLVPSDLLYYQAVEGDAGTSTDAFITFFTSNKQMKWSTYYGGAGQDEGRGLALDASSNLYIAGMKSNDVMPLKFSAGTVLPIQLISFSGKAEDSANRLSWETESETDNSYFSVERTTDGLSFQSVATVNGAGTSTGSHFYEAYDEHPASGTNYYRLKQTDENGNSSYSQLIAIISTDRQIDPLIFPNPVSGTLNILFFSAEENSGTIEILDVLGRPCLTENVEIQKGTNLKTLETSSLVSGLYSVFIHSSHESIRLRFKKN